jgi:hypothetical protein
VPTDDDMTPYEIAREDDAYWDAKYDAEPDTDDEP